MSLKNLLQSHVVPTQLVWRN